MDINISNFSIAALKNAADEFRASVYPRNETERKVLLILHVHCALCVYFISFRFMKRFLPKIGVHLPL
jgi:hypothetical protein